MFTTTKRGKKLLTHNGQVYTFDRYSACGNFSFWRCQYKNSCTGRVHLCEKTQTVIYNFLNYFYL